MTTRYLQIPTKPFDLVNPDTGEAIAETLPVSLVLRALVNRLTPEPLDVLEAFVLLQKLTAGGVIALDEKEHQALAAEAKKPKGLALAAVMSPSVNAFLRSIVDAPSVRPEASSPTTAPSGPA